MRHPVMRYRFRITWKRMILTHWMLCLCLMVITIHLQLICLKSNISIVIGILLDSLELKRAILLRRVILVFLSCRIIPVRNTVYFLSINRLFQILVNIPYRCILVLIRVGSRMMDSRLNIYSPLNLQIQSLRNWMLMRFSRPVIIHMILHSRLTLPLPDLHLFQNLNLLLRCLMAVIFRYPLLV